MTVNSTKQAQIKAEIMILLFYKALTAILAEYCNYGNIFSVKNKIKLSKNTGIYQHAIKLVENKQPPFEPIYCLKPVELETLKTYIEIILTNGFIRPSKSLAEVPIFLDRKPNKTFCLCVDYQDLNNPIIKNLYLLPLIGKSFN